MRKHGVSGKCRPLAAVALAVVASACGGDAEEAAAPGAQAPEVARALPGSLEWALAGDWRLPEERERDSALKTVETARALGLDDAQSVLELAPGAGAWTAVIAPVLAARGGSYSVLLAPAEPAAPGEGLADRFRERFADEALFGAVATVELGAAEEGAAIPPDSIEVAFTVDDIAVWMALGQAEQAFAAAFAALEPGGTLGVVQPRAPTSAPPDPGAASGYVQEAQVLRLADEAGFTLESASELLANPADDADHPFGVWTLAPWRLTAPLGEPADPEFDRAPYDAIGEPDRMLLLFRKP